MFIYLSTHVDGHLGLFQFLNFYDNYSCEKTTWEFKINSSYIQA